MRSPLLGCRPVLFVCRSIPVVLRLFAGALALTSARADAAVSLAPDIVLSRDVVIGRVTDVAVDAAGQVYVLDGGFDKICIFGEDGSYLRSIGRKGEGPGEFYEPRSLAIDPDGNVFVGGASDRIVGLAPDGQGIGSLVRGRTSAVSSLRFGSDGSLFAVYLDVVTHLMVHRFESATEEAAPTVSFSESFAVGRETSLDVEVAFASGSIDVAGDGRVFYAQLTPQIVRTYAQTGEFLRAFEVRSAERRPPSEPSRNNGGVFFASVPSATTDITVLSDGSFVLSEYLAGEEGAYDCLVDVYDPDGRRVFSESRPGKFTVICRDAHDRLYIAEEDGEETVVKRYRVVRE